MVNKITTKDFEVPLSSLSLPKIIMRDPTMPFLEAASLMYTNKIGSLVLGDEGRVEGIFTERDIIRKADTILNDRSILLKDIMTQAPLTINEDALLLDAISIMSSREFRHIPIVDKEGIVTSIISIKDILKFILSIFSEYFKKYQAIPDWSKANINLQEDAILYDLNKKSGELREDVLSSSLRRAGSQNFSFLTHTKSIKEVLERMHLKSHSVALITEFETELAGIVTERDLLFKVFSKDINLNDPVTTIMTHKPHVLSTDSHLGHALKNMFVYNYRNIPLINAEGYPTGVVSLLDILIFIGNELGVRNVLRYL